MILIALGANLLGPHGSPEQTLVAAIAALRKSGLKILKVSRFWQTEPVPVSDDPWFTNAVMVAETGLKPGDLYQLLKDTEVAFGRSGSAQNAPRILDLDLIAYDDQRIETADLTVPHPRMEGRAFVLLPLAEVAPGWRHPVFGKTVEEMISEMPEGQQAIPLVQAA